MSSLTKQSLTKQSRTHNNATIKKLEELIKPLTEHLNLKAFNGLNKNGKIIYGKKVSHLYFQKQVQDI